MIAAARVNHTDAVLHALRSMVPSGLPALVFTSLAALCVPAFSDRCHIFIEEDGLGAYWIERPLSGTVDLPGAANMTGPAGSQFADSPLAGSQPGVRDAWSGQWVGDHSVQTAFDQTATEGCIGFRGSVVHSWNDDYRRNGTDVALAQFAVDHAMAMTRRE